MVESTLVILTWNEIDALRSMFEKIPLDSVDEVIAVDAGSVDGTIEFFKKRGIRTVIQKIPGRGRAFVEAAGHARGKYIVFFSPDGNENPADIPKLLGKIRGGYDLVIASRFMKGARSDDSDDPALVRHLGNNFFTLLVDLFWGARVTDAVNGFRAVRKESLERLNQDATGHEIEFQMTIRSAKLGYRIAEIPTIEGARIGGKRKALTLVMGVRFAKFFLRELLLGKKFLENERR